MSKIIKIKKGLDIPLQGEAEKILNTSPRSSVYSVYPSDFHGLTPKMLVKEGDRVKAGTPLFSDKYNEKILFISPVSGVFTDLVRGEKRKILEIRIKADEQDSYEEFGTADPASLSRVEVVERLLKSGLWPFLRQRPYSVVANPATMPKAIFISAFDTSPLGVDYDFIINGQEKEFQIGVNVLRILTEGKVHLSLHTELNKNAAFEAVQGVEHHYFKGPHPAGNIGVQIHHIDPINKGDVVWHAGVQDIIIIGRLFSKGVADFSKMIAVAGSEILNPRYYRTIYGAAVSNIVGTNVRKEDDLNVRFISGNPLTGNNVGANGFLGYYHDQITALPEGDKPELLGWIMPNFDKFSVSRSFPAFLMPWRKYRHNTNIRSGERPFVVTGAYEKVFPMDIMPMQLLKSIMINDIDMMEKLGIYEVAPEDFALCEYVCPSKIEMQACIREGLDVIRKEFA